MKNEFTSQIRLPVHVEQTTYEVPTEWRLVGAEGKADHIVDLCMRNGIVPSSLLEVGAGDGAILAWLGKKSFCKVMHAVEISQSGVQVILNQRIPGLVSCQTFDGYSLPFKDDSLDLVILSHVLEHVEYERALLREVARVSKYQVIEIPMDFAGLENDHFCILGPSYGHINAHSPASLRFLLSTENLVVLDSLLGQYELAVQEYDYFVNNSRGKTPESVTAFRARFEAERKVFDALPLGQRERRASFYAVLTKKESASERTLRALTAAKSYIQSGQVQAARLIFKHYIQKENELEASLDIAQFCLQAKQWRAGLQFVDQALKMDESHSEALAAKAVLQEQSSQQPHVLGPGSSYVVRSTWNRFKGHLKMNFPCLVSVARKLYR